MTEEKLQMFRNRLAKLARHTGKLARKQGVTCYRLYDHDLPEFPFCIEFYGDKLYVAEYRRRHNLEEEEHEIWIEKSLEVMTEILGVEKENIFLKLRQRKAGRLGQYQKLNASLHEFVVSEAGLNFIVNLSDYLDTGLFLDHRVTRQLVREQSAGKKVLNLFAYTGSFSVYAAAGGAAEVVTVDLSKTYLAWAERNMKANDFYDAGRHQFVHADVIQYLKKMAPQSVDLIIMDPPTFSNSKRMEGFLDIQADHVTLVNDCMAALKPGGILYFSTNMRGFVLNEKNIRAESVKDLTRATTPFDFEGKLFRYCYRFIKKG